jgi:hypothetical protein
VVFSERGFDHSGHLSVIARIVASDMSEASGEIVFLDDFDDHLGQLLACMFSNNFLKCQNAFP